jgi:hypothetical protein
LDAAYAWTRSDHPHRQGITTETIIIFIFSSSQILRETHDHPQLGLQDMTRRILAATAEIARNILKYF